MNWRRRQVLLAVFRVVRSGIYRSLATWDKVWGNQNPLAIYCYHSIGDDWRFSVRQSELKKQLFYLAGQGTPVTLSDVEAYLQGRKELPRPAFAITFDDGYADIFESKHLFRRLGIRPTVFVLSDRKAANRNILATEKPLLEPVQIKSLRKSGWYIGSHSATHSVLTNLNKDRLRHEITDSKRKLQRMIGAPVRFFSYPKGKYSNSVIETVNRAGYTIAVSMDDGLIGRDTSRVHVPRIGVDQTHSFSEFTTLASPSVVAFRNMVKRSAFGKYV